MCIRDSVDADSLQISDFALTGTNGFTDSSSSAVSEISSVTAGADHTIVIGLSDYLLANQYTLEILGSEFTSGGIAGTDSSISFTVLPGDVTQDGANTVTTGDLFATAGLLGEQITEGFTSDDFSFRADVNGDNVINTADFFAIASRLADQLVLTSLTTVSSVSVIDDSTDEPPLESGSASEELSLHGAEEDNAKLPTVDNTFEDLYSDESEGEVDFESDQYVDAADNLFESNSLDLA